MQNAQVSNTLMFSNIKPSTVNSSFDLATVRIAAINREANGFVFSKESFEKAKPSLKNIPIVSLYKEDEEDFGGHERGYEFKDGDIKVIYNTQPFGIIHESANMWYEDVEENGVGVTYLMSECLLWKRQKSYDLVKKFGTFSTSMEIEIQSQHFDNKTKLSHVNDFIFTAIAVLGRNVNPAFKQSQISLFSENRDYIDMLNEYKQFSIESFEGGEGMKDEEVKVENVEVTEVVEEAIEDTKTEETKEEVVEEQVQESNDVEAVNEETEKEESVVEEEIAETVEEQVQEVSQIDYELKFNELQVEYGKVVSKLNEMQEEFTRLQKFELNVLAEQRKNQELDLFAKFSKLNGLLEFEVLKSNCSQMSLEQIETMCFAIVGRQSFSEKPKTKTTQTSLKMDFSSKQDTKPLAYGGILGYK